jgi:hypothetical protein
VGFERRDSEPLRVQPAREPDSEKYLLLKEQRLIYRLSLGQPNQEDLVDFLARGRPALTKLLQPLTLDLSAFARNKFDERI